MQSASRFTPYYAKIDECVSIGSGNGIEAYREHVRHADKNPMPMMKMEVGTRQGMGRVLAMTTAITVRQNPTPGVSRYFHLATVTRGRIEIVPVNIGEPGEDGDFLEDPMPPVATTWPEFQAFARQRGLAEGSASASP